MGIEAAVLGPLLGATVSTAGSFIAQSANASAQSSINERTMEFNRAEAEKARNFQAQQAVIDRQFNSAEALRQRQFAAEQGEIGRTYDAQQALLAREFEERMSSSAHQREVNDLRLAGLNPILSATGGNGASTPAAPVVGAPAVSGTSASHSGTGSAQASVGNLNAYMKENILGKFVNSAMDGLRLSNDMKFAESKDIEAHAKKLQAETDAKRQAMEEKKINKEIERIDSDITIAFEDLDIRKQLKDADIEKTHAVIDELYSKVGVNQGMANKLNMETQELKRKIKYGAFLATYLPDEPAEWIYSKLGSIVKNNPAFDDFIDKYSTAMSLDEKRELALNAYELIKKSYEGSD